MGIFGAVDPQQIEENDLGDIVEWLKKISEQLDVLIQKP